MTAWLNVKNNAESALATAITAAAATLTLVSGEGSKFPSSNFNITIDDEILTCSSRTGDVLTVTRAQEGTSAAIHAAGAIVALNVTAAVISQLQAAIDGVTVAVDDTPVDGHTTIPVSSNALYDHAAGTSHGGLDLAAHAARHKWLGADAINIKDLLLADCYPFYLKDWRDNSGFTASHTNSGSFVNGLIFGQLTTGATNNSRACLYTSTPAIFYTNNSNYYSRFKIRLNPITAMNNLTAWFGCLTNPTAPTTTENHIAFKMVNGDIYASVGDGATNNLQDTGVDIAQYSIINLHYRQIGTTVYFYVNDVLKATLSSNVPNPGPAVYLTMYMLNSAAENKNIYVYPMYFMLGAE